MQAGKEEKKALGSHPASERVGAVVAGAFWHGFNVWISCGSVLSADGSPPYGNWEQNGAAASPAAASGSCWERVGMCREANMSPDGQGGTRYVLKKVIYALIGLEASLFQALVCLSQWPYLLMH